MIPETIDRHRKHDLIFQVRKSIRYHDYRRAHYLYLETTIKILALVAGSAVITQNFGGAGWTQWVGVLVVIGTAASTVRNFGAMHYLHNSLYEDFVSLERDFIGSEDLDALEVQLLEIERKEPPIYSALNRYCHNQQCRVQRQPEHVKTLHLHQVLFKNIFRFQNLPVD